MRITNIKILPFDFIDLLDFQMQVGENNHGAVQFRGTIPADNQQQYMELISSETWVQCIGENEEGEFPTFFCGVLMTLDIYAENGVYILSGEAKTGTQLMALRQHFRSFQTPGITYLEVQNTIMDAYSVGNYIMTFDSDISTNGLLVQYLETDWEFLIRLASVNNTVILPSYTTMGSKYYFGIPDIQYIPDFSSNHYTLQKDLYSINYKNAHDLAFSETDGISIKFESRECYQLGSQIIFNKNLCYVSNVNGVMKGAELYHTYQLKPKSGSRVPKQYNPYISGTSLPGTVLEVAQTNVKIHLHNDENPSCGTRWFPYSTVYSSPDGTGWYCMPEPGDTIRLYFPDRDEIQAYAASAVHMPGDSQSRMNPDFKSLKNKYGKEVLLTPNSITLTNNNGMSVSLTDGKGISINSDSRIIIQSGEGIEIVSNSASVEIAGTNYVSLQQGGTAIMIDDNISFSGAQIKMN